MQAAEEDGHHRLLRPLRQDQAPGLQGEAHWQEEEDHGEDCQPEPLLQRILCLCRRGDVPEKGNTVVESTALWLF